MDNAELSSDTSEATVETLSDLFCPNAHGPAPSRRRYHRRPTKRATRGSFLAGQYSNFLHSRWNAEKPGSENESAESATELDSIQAEEDRLLATLERQAADLNAKLSSYSSYSSQLASSSSTRTL